MRRVLHTCALFICLVICPFSRGIACGYAFIGDCSTSIGLRINGTLDSFAIASCPFGARFDGLDLGQIQQLQLVKAKGITWESCQNNVSGMSLFYRVYPQGQTGGAWQQLQLEEDYNTLVGPYTTRYRSKTTNLGLTNGLVTGTAYYLEIYLRAEIDTIGDDFIPETFILQNNEGQNFKLAFEYGGASAPPFTVVTTQHKDVPCFGDSSGVAGVSVYGNLNGLFYDWQGFSNNFPVLSDVPAGVYTVIVSGAGGYSQSQSIDIQQPPALSAQFIDVLPVGCEGQAGQATVEVFGGTAPYQYHWDTGTMDAAAIFATPGNRQVTITDGHACSAVFGLSVPSGWATEQYEFLEFCQGQALTYHGYALPGAGSYDLILDAQGACDTLAHLTVTVLDPAVYLENLPATVYLDCAHPTEEICLDALAGLSYTWSSPSGNMEQGNCYTLNQSDENVEVTALWQGLQIGCSTVADVQVVVSTAVPAMTFTTFSASGAQATDGSIWVVASGGVPPYTISWEGFGSSQDSVLILEQLSPGIYCFTVTGANGCSATACATVSYASHSETPVETKSPVFPNPALPGQTIHLTWTDSPTTRVELFQHNGQKQMLEISGRAGKEVQIALPEFINAGVYVLRVDGRAVPLLIQPDR